MAYVLQHLMVANYEEFKSVFDFDSSRRLQTGSKGGRLFRSPDNPKEFVVLFEWKDMDSARQFTGSSELREATALAGVKQITQYVLEEVEEVKA